MQCWIVIQHKVTGIVENSEEDDSMQRHGATNVSSYVHMDPYESRFQLWYMTLVYNET